MPNEATWARQGRQVGSWKQTSCRHRTCCLGHQASCPNFNAHSNTLERQSTRLSSCRHCANPVWPSQPSPARPYRADAAHDVQDGLRFHVYNTLHNSKKPSAVQSGKAMPCRHASPRGESVSRCWVSDAAASSCNPGQCAGLDGIHCFLNYMHSIYLNQGPHALVVDTGQRTGEGGLGRAAQRSRLHGPCRAAGSQGRRRSVRRQSSPTAS